MAVGFSPIQPLLLLAWAALLACTQPALSDGGASFVDLELVLAVDTSGSMSRADLQAQRQGYVEALRHPDFALAIATRGSVAIAYVEWAGPNDQELIVPWTIVTDATTAASLAERLEAAPLRPGFGSPPWQTGTSISNALLFSAGLFDSPYASRVIDISGNGPNNIGRPLASVRKQVVAQGITVNGLPIPGRVGLDALFPIAAYYEGCVIGGPGAFALAVTDATGFATAVRRKMILEVAVIPPMPVLAGYAMPEPSQVDCAAPESGR